MRSSPMKRSRERIAARSEMRPACDTLPSTVAEMLPAMSMPRKRPAVLAILRHHADAGGDSVPRAAEAALARPSSRTCPARERPRAEDRLAGLRAARADEPGEADDLAGANGEARIAAQAARRASVLDLEHARSRRARAGLAGEMHVAPDHEPDQLVGRRLGDLRACR